MDKEKGNAVVQGGDGGQGGLGGLESPPSPSSFFDPSKEIDIHRHRLPHWQQSEVFYFVTWRLADSLPQSKLKQWREEKDNWLCAHPEPWDGETEEEYHRLFSDRIDKWLDAGEGSCVLRDPALANIVAGAFQYFDGKRGTLWQEDYWDRMIRNERHYFKCIEYIQKNPERAKLKTGEYVLFVRGEGGHSCPPVEPIE
jgi:type I restriction enzyme R subunit